jgi:hypothetical protein
MAREGMRGCIGGAWRCCCGGVHACAASEGRTAAAAACSRGPAGFRRAGCRARCHPCNPAPRANARVAAGDRGPKPATECSDRRRHANARDLCALSSIYLWAPFSFVFLFLSLFLGGFVSVLAINCGCLGEAGGDEGHGVLDVLPLDDEMLFYLSVARSPTVDERGRSQVGFTGLRSRLGILSSDKRIFIPVSSPLALLSLADPPLVFLIALIYDCFVLFFLFKVQGEALQLQCHVLRVP